MVRCCFFIHFLVAEDYELPKSASHILGLPLTLECVRILSWFIFFFYFNCFPHDALWRLLSELMILPSTHPVTNHMTYRKKLRYAMSCNLILMWICNTKNIRKFNSASNYIRIFGKLFYNYKLIHIDLKSRMLIASFLLLIAPLLNN